MVKRPKEYVWSSYHANGWGNESWLKQHDEYKRLGRTKEERCRYYRELFKHHADGVDIELIRKASSSCQPVGDNRFKRLIEKKYGIKLGRDRRGRPENMGC